MPVNPAQFAPTEDQTSILEGSIRPHFFRGVATVVSKLFNIIQPTHAFFGQKDIQQCSVVRTMVRDLMFPTEIVVVPTVREHDGLAKSSRNRYLSQNERAIAPVLYQAFAASKEYELGERNRNKLLAAAESFATMGIKSLDFGSSKAIVECQDDENNSHGKSDESNDEETDDEGSVDHGKRMTKRKRKRMTPKRMPSNSSNNLKLPNRLHSIISKKDAKVAARRRKYKHNKRQTLKKDGLNFLDKDQAKRTAATLNNTIIGGKNETEMVQAKRENKVYLKNVSKAKMIQAMEAKKSLKRDREANDDETKASQASSPLWLLSLLPIPYQTLRLFVDLSSSAK
ncbi:pantoate-beta-alanine ligase [Batrachochytrium salamandrivorans]|nr:pantoate-beta-alanine ligase [Batrachochytrium salamandrivorans]